MRILIIQTAFIGDVVLTTPFLAALRQRWPEAELHVVATRPGCEMLEGLAGVRLHPIEKHSKGFFASISGVLDSLGRGTEFDVAFSVHRSFRSLWLARKARAKRRIAFKTFWSGIMGFETVEYPPYRDDLHYSDKPLRLLAPFGELPKTPRPALAAASPNPLRAKLDGLGRYVVLSPFSVWGTKMWFADRFARVGIEIARRFQVSIVVIGSGSGSEKIIGQTISEKIIQSGGKALSLVGETNISGLKEAVRGAWFVVANDSAPVHVAAAYNVPTVAIFGPTVRKWGFFPLSDRSVVVERPDLPCRPCHIHGPPRCPKRHFKCMNEIQVEDVVQAVQNLVR